MSFKLRALSATVALVPLMVVPVQAQIIEELVASVNGEAVTRSELQSLEEDRRAQLHSRLSGDELDQALREVMPTVLVDLINEKLLYQQAERMGLDFDQVYRSIVDNLKRQNKIETSDELRDLLRQQGTSMSEFRDQVLRANVPDILLNIEVRQKIAVSDAEIQAYYEDNQELFSRPTKYTFREIGLLLSLHTRDEALTLAREIIDAAAGGAEFASLVEQYSEAPSKEAGGLVEDVKAADLSAQIRGALENVPEGAVSEPVVTSRAVMVFHVESRQDAHVETLENAHNWIDGMLRRGRLGEEIDKYLTKLWAENRIYIVPKYEKRYETDKYRGSEES